MSKSKHPLRKLPASTQTAIKKRIERLAPYLQLGMSPAQLIRALWSDTIPRENPPKP